MTRRLSLPGSKASAASPRDFAKASTRGAALFGPRLVPLLGATTRTRTTLHRAERAWANRAIDALEISLRTEGLQVIDGAQPYVVAPLHEGFLDAVALHRLPLDLTFVASNELFSWKLLGRYLRWSGQTPIDQTDATVAYRSMVRAGKAAVARGESIVVFPQGSILGIETAFFPGAFHLARHLDIPVLPVVLTGAASVWDYPFDTTLRFGRRMHLQTLAPIPPHRAVTEADRLEREMKDLALASDPQPRRFDPGRDGWWDGYRYEIDPRFSQLHRAVEDHRSAQLAAVD